MSMGISDRDGGGNGDAVPRAEPERGRLRDNWREQHVRCPLACHGRRAPAQVCLPPVHPATLVDVTVRFGLASGSGQGGGLWCWCMTRISTF
ncbi:hypothetical protein FRAAL3388 [Frankia alni ACN14a]|uniref:Uncharacterized protein n=1 Tax=Frankia alni (strain DSM 45986 / CECT 9034 / ACN14a) TaxID=326424 RepID=Q0RKC6_FRAAA|nr:hypothetical protein FRAAL3388 [Frankia alni ACN14a]